ncbi:hypothetical protein [Prochlorococcus marinus]|uniref:hypothetical protein n=1 Tax=Prochlorococcus marinus TaxID=1219 RepID=UPI001ADACD15|nr:hypothetical protein [Prochlorococcus marinus]MBO8205142.1 hypothetical protein [Prochlorococcus marinus CUG1415]
MKYINDRTEVIIGCPVHGFIPMKPFNHLRNRESNTGCRFCGEERSRQATIQRNIAGTKKQEVLIKQFNDFWGVGKFDYSKVKYIKDESKITVICPKEGHGEFLIKASDHLRGTGCKACQIDNMRNDLKDKKIGKIHILRTVTKEEKREKGKKGKDLYWWVKCSCGSDEFMIATTNIVQGGVTSCIVCSIRDKQLRVKKRNWEKIKGKKFGRLLIHRQWGSDKKSRSRVLCLCDCGSTHIAEEYAVKTGGTTSCGCVPKGEDSYDYFLKNDEYAKGDCYFYIADLDDNYLKAGISNELPVRKSTLKYRSYDFESPSLCRCEAWAIEQIILFETQNAAPKATPKKFAWWGGGQTEIRLRKVHDSFFYKTRFYELLEEMHIIGWEKLYLEKFGSKKEC